MTRSTGLNVWADGVDNGLVAAALPNRLIAVAAADGRDFFAPLSLLQLAEHDLRLLQRFFAAYSLQSLLDPLPQPSFGHSGHLARPFKRHDAVGQRKARA